MCYFVTIAVTEAAAKYLKEEVRPEISAWQCENRHIMTHLDAGFRGYVLTTGMCSCDLCSSPSDHQTPKKHAQILQKKYKEKGWSEAKIQRAITDATTAGKPNLRGLRADARDLIARVAEASKRVYVFVHMYSGDQRTEEVVVKQGPSVLSSDFSSGAYVLECDTLVTVRKQN